MPNLNIGAGAKPLEGYINIDVRDLPGIDLVCDARALPWPDNHFDKVRAESVLEHFSWRETDAVLKEWVRVLKIGGSIRVKVPCWEYILEYYNSNVKRSPDNFHWVVKLIFGNQEFPENEHKTIFSGRSLQTALTKVRIANIKTKRYGWTDSPTRQGIIMEGVKY